MAVNFYWLDRIQPEQRLLVGNKAFQLSQLLQKGYPVVPGFVISAQWLRRFLETIEWTVPLFADLTHSSLRLNINNPQQLRDIAHQIRQTVEAHPLPAEWTAALVEAVNELPAPVVTLRASLAIQSERTLSRVRRLNPVVCGKSSALLNLQVCHADAVSLATGLKRLWAELFSARSLFYWQRSGIPLPQVNLAVLVQPLQPAIAAGTVQVSQTGWQVQSTVGLGMAIAWGEVIPDLDQIDAMSGTVSVHYPGRKTIAYAVINAASDHSPDQPPAIPLPVATSTHRDRPVPLPSATPPLFPSQSPGLLSGTPVLPPLYAYLLAETAQATPALSDSDRVTLIQLVQRLLSDLEAPLELEWTLCQQSTDHAPCFLLTQVIPGPPSAVRALPTRADTTSVPSAAPPPRLAGDLIATGLAASPGQVLACARVITPLDEPPDIIPPHTVLVAATIPPSWLNLIKQAAAIITEAGGMTSHSAIIAREVGVPAVMAAANIMHQVHSGAMLRVDGTEGKVYWATEGSAFPDEHFAIATTNPPFYGATPAVRGSKLSAALQTVSMPVSEVFSVHDRPPIGTQLMVNLSQPESLSRLTDGLVDGIGLLRSELLITALLGNQDPLVWIHQGRQAELIECLGNAIGQFARALNPRPVFYRSLDRRSHEFPQQSGNVPLPPETNPMLGVRGTFSYVINPTLFNVELMALAQVQSAGYSNIHLLLPFVRTVEEFRFCYRQAELVGLTNTPNFQVRIMAEVPSVLFLLPEYVKAGVQGIAIGTNDLTQLLLGVDRDYGPMVSAFDERHPAVKAAIAHLIKRARQAGIPCSICGQAPVRYPELIPDLIRWGITTISVEPEALASTYQAIARAERQFLLEQTRHQFQSPTENSE